MRVDLICPLYNAENDILPLYQSLQIQKQIDLHIHFILTESSDKTEEILQNNHINYTKIKKEDFSHSLTREKEALKYNQGILVFITQDIVIEDELMIYKLVHDIELGKCEASYARQISKFNNIEKYTREKNYPENARIVSKKDINELGLKTFFFSDACSAIRGNVYSKLNGYDGKKLPISEDMYIAYKLIMNDYRIKYESTAIVYHSHNFSLKELYNRYKLTGKFFKENSYLNKYGTTKAGGGLAKYILKRALKDKNIKVLIRYPFDMAARLIGMKVGGLQ